MNPTILTIHSKANVKWKRHDELKAEIKKEMDGYKLDNPYEQIGYLLVSYAMVATRAEMLEKELEKFLHY